MYKEVIKISILLLAAGLFACGNEKSEQQVQAEDLLATAQNQYNDGQYDEAVGTIDSLAKTFPGFIDVQKNAMHLKTLITEKKTIQDSITNDYVILENRGVVDSLSRNFKYVKTKDMVEGYWVEKSVPENNLVKRTNIEARIDEAGKIYIITSLYGNAVKHTSLTARANGAEASTKVVPTGNSNNYRYSDGGTPVEMVTFNNENCDTICQFISENKASNISVTFNGNKSAKITLSAAAARQIADTYDYATKKAALKKAEDLKLYYSKKLQITRRQVRSTATNIKGDAK